MGPESERLRLLLWILVLQSLIMTGVYGGPQQVPYDDSSTANLQTLHYPHVKIGPYNWQYFRAEVPRMFRELKIELIRNWDSAKINEYGALKPLVCFRLGAPPSPTTALDSMEVAATAAGLLHKAPNMGHCAWFFNTSVATLNNQQVSAGTWHVGVYSNPQPTRFQSKMISRGPTYTFGLHITVSRCNSSSLTGSNCNLTVTHLCSELSNPTPISTQLEVKPKPTPIQEEYPPQSSTSDSDGTDAPWGSLNDQEIGPSDWKYFGLQVAQFTTKMDIRVVTSNLSDTSLKLKLSIRYGVLPDGSSIISDEVHISIPVPKRGWWYIGVMNPAEKRGILFSLHWRIEGCGEGQSTGERKSSVSSLERVLQENPSESPFDSFYTRSRDPAFSPAEWFLLQPISRLTSSTMSPSDLDEWKYFFIEIPHGVVGAVLSMELRHVLYSNTYLYARHEGLPTLKDFDFQTDNLHLQIESKVSHGFSDESKENNTRLSSSGDRVALHVMFPMEGMWCVGVRFMNPELRLVVDKVVETETEMFPSISPEAIRPKSTAPLLNKNSFRIYFERFLEGRRYSFQQRKAGQGAKVFVPSLVSQISFTEVISPLKGIEGEEEHQRAHEEKKDKILEEDPVQTLSSSGLRTHVENGKSFEGASREDPERNKLPGVQMRVTIHGCLNQCSGHGNCQTTFEASRLYLYSYCHCDVTHGGDDCSVVLLLPAEETLHIWALVGSNFASIMPASWAIRHHAYAEWLTYTVSGVASGVYHSCDAGGWCVLSYDTLQFLDFWLSFLSVVITCLYIAAFADDTKALAHMGAAILTAAVTKENATSAWNVLLVVLMGAAGLIFGWALECSRVHLIPTWLHALGPLQGTFGLQVMYRRGEEFMAQMKKRFRWVYLSTGLAILMAAGFSWILETDDTYWIWHSLWHVSIYTSAFVILCSTSSPRWPDHSNRIALVHSRASVTEDPELGGQILRHAVDLDTSCLDSEEEDKLLKS